MASLSRVPLEEYLSTSYEPECEYVNGHLVDRHVGEYYHSLLQNLVAAKLNERSREQRFRAFIALRVCVSDSPTIRVPDVCVKALPYHKAPVLVSPDLVIEILSPDDEPLEMLEKIGDYQRAGIPYVWIVDPYKRTLLQVDSTGIHRPVGTILSTPLVGEIDFALLFQQLDEPSE